MKSFSIKSLHDKLKKNINLAESYSEIKEIGFIIRSCRLKPYDYVFKDRNHTYKLYKIWFDEFGNFLKILKRKKIEFAYNDLSIERQKLISTDLYYGLSLDKQLKISKLAFIFTGKDEDLDLECNFVALLGLDDYLRCFMYLYDEWVQVSPLLLGIKNFKILFKNLDVKYFIEVKNKNYPIPCNSCKSWITSLPVPDKLVTELDRETKNIIPEFFPERKF